MKKKEKNSIIKSIIAILVLLVVIAGASYAYFTARISGNDSAKKTTISSGKLIVDFATGDYINNTSALPIADADRATKADKTTFTVKHNTSSTVAATYSLYLTDINISNNFKSTEFKWELLKGSTAVATGDFSGIGTNTSMDLLTNQNLPLGQTDSYTLRVWLSSTDEDQSDLYNGTFNAKVAIDSTAV